MPKTNGNITSYELSLCQTTTDPTKSGGELSDLPSTNEGVGLGWLDYMSSGNLFG